MEKIYVDWAIQTKQPKDTQDYRVLACSAGDLDADAYDKLIRKWMTGEVPLDSTYYNPAAPWYQFGIEKNPQQIILIKQEWAGYGDFTNRPALKSTCLLIPYKKMAAAGCGFKQMMDIFKMEWESCYLKERGNKIRDGEINLHDEKMPILLPGQEDSKKWMKEAIGGIGLNACLRGINILLKGHLKLVPSDIEIPDIDERAKWLDGIMALLPYGIRANCPASLWVSGNVSDDLCLYWGRAGYNENDDVYLIARRKEEITGTTCLHEYASKVTDLIGKESLDGLLQILLEDTEPQTLININAINKVRISPKIEQIPKIKITRKAKPLHQQFTTPRRKKTSFGGCSLLFLFLLLLFLLPFL